MRCFQCDDTFMDLEDFRDHLPCEGTREAREAQFDRQLKEVKAEFANYKERVVDTLHYDMKAIISDTPENIAQTTIRTLTTELARANARIAELEAQLERELEKVKMDYAHSRNATGVLTLELIGAQERIAKLEQAIDNAVKNGDYSFEGR